MARFSKSDRAKHLPHRNPPRRYQRRKKKNPYIVFYMAMLEAYPSCAVKVVAKKAGQLWNTMSPCEKQVYKDRVRQSARTCRGCQQDVNTESPTTHSRQQDGRVSTGLTGCVRETTASTLRHTRRGSIVERRTSTVPAAPDPYFYVNSAPDAAVNDASGGSVVPEPHARYDYVSTSEHCGCCRRAPTPAERPPSHSGGVGGSKTSQHRAKVAVHRDVKQPSTSTTTTPILVEALRQRCNSSREQRCPCVKEASKTSHTPHTRRNRQARHTHTPHSPTTCQTHQTPQTPPTCQTHKTPQTPPTCQTHKTHKTTHTPNNSHTPQTLQTPQTPQTCQTHQTHQTPQTPPTCQTHQNHQTPHTSHTPQAHQSPQTPQTHQTPQTPHTSHTPQTHQTPQTPHTHQTCQTHQTHQTLPHRRYSGAMVKQRCPCGTEYDMPIEELYSNNNNNHNNNTRKLCRCGKQHHHHATAQQHQQQQHRQRVAHTRSRCRCGRRDCNSAKRRSKSQSSRSNENTGGLTSRCPHSGGKNNKKRPTPDRNNGSNSSTNKKPHYSGWYT